MTPIETLEKIDKDIQGIVEENIDYYEGEMDILQGFKNIQRISREMVKKLEKFNAIMWDNQP